jgi:hypothetical protein
MPGPEGGEGLDVTRSRAGRLPAQFGGTPRVAEKVVTLTVPKPADGPALNASQHAPHRHQRGDRQTMWAAARPRGKLRACPPR